jgi:hypothetical protein
VYEQKEYSITNKIECLATYKNLFTEMLKIDYDFDFPGYNYGNDNETNNNHNSGGGGVSLISARSDANDNVFTATTSSSATITNSNSASPVQQKNRRQQPQQKSIQKQIKHESNDDINENSVGLEEFNSHQYWYIKPAIDVTLDLGSFELTPVQDDDNHSNKTLIYESEYILNCEFFTKFRIFLYLKLVL